MNTHIRRSSRPSQFIIKTLIAAAALVGVDFVQASPDPPVSITNGVALFEGNQTNGIASGVDFQPAQVGTLDVNSLSTPIRPANAVPGIYFQNSGAGNVIINAGLSGSNIVINTTGAAGINAGSVGSPPSNPPNDPFLGIPIPSTNSTVPGGVVNVQSHSDIITHGDNSAGIVATSQTTGYSQAVIQQLTNFTGAGITFTVDGVTNVDGSAGTIGGPVTGTLVDTNGTNIAGNGGTFVINTDGSFSFDPGTNFDGLTNGQTVQTIVNYAVHGINGTGLTNDSSGTLVTTITMTTNGLVFDSGAYLDAYGPSTNQNSVLPDLASYGQTLVEIASAGGAGNSVTVDNEGSITTHGTNSFGILAQSIGGNGATGGGGTWLHSAGGGTAGSSGGKVTVTANGSITTISNYSCGVVAWSQGGTGGQGGYGGTWRYGGPGGTGGNGGEVYVNGDGVITTHGDYASGILAVSAGGNGGASGGSKKIFTGGGDGGNGGQGGAVTVDGDWNITTTGDYAHGIWAKSVGGNAGSGGSGGWLFGHPGNGGQATDGGTVIVRSGGTIETSGDNSYGIYAESVGGFGGQGGGQGGIFYSHGGSGESAGSGGDVYVTQDAGGQIITYGTNAHGIFAESIGGGGGSGGGAGAIVGVGGTGGAGGNGGNVTVTNYGEIQTFGEYSRGIYAQSIGGGGGDGAGSGGLVGIGGSSSGVSYGGKVSLFNFGGVLTSNDNSDAICAQSIGGGGGSGGGSGGLFSIGGSGNGGGSASNVDVVNSGQIFTYGTNSRGIFIESIGGGGGDGAGSGGVISIGGSGSSAGNGGVVTLANSGMITTTGSLSSAIEVQSIGGGGGDGAGSGGLISIGGGADSGGNGAAVIVTNSGAITTFGNYARGIYLQSIGGGGGGGAGSGGVISIGGGGSLGGNGGTVTLTNSGSVTTWGDNADAIFAQSIGGGGGSGGGSGGVISIGGKGGGGGDGESITIANSGTLYTAGTNSCGIFGQSVGGGGGNGAGSGGALASIGGKGGGANNGGAVNIENSGNITTMSNFSYSIFAESIGGGGGSGRGSGALTFSMGGNGAGGGDGGLVQVINTGVLTTYGSNASGIFAESVGGGGGNGAGTGAWTVSLGGDGGDSGNGGIVSVTNAGAITTHGDYSPTIFAQSVGGGGGNANTVGAVIFSLGGDGESGGNGSNVTVTTSQQLGAFGLNSSGIFAQSVGGKGGNGGNVVNVSAAPNLDFSVGIGGGGGDGGDGGVVTINSDSDIITSGTNSQGIVAQSVGGGGGNGGNAFVLSAAANVIEDFPAVDIAVSVGGKGGKGGDGGAVVVQNSGTIITSNSLSAGILAQSVGGGGGNGGNSTTVSLTYNCDVTASAAVGGKGGVAGNGGAVGVTNNGGIRTEGNYSSGIFAQSVGGGGGQGGNSTTISGDLSVLKDAKDISPSYSFTMSMGGNGGGGGTGGTVNVNSFNNIITKGAFSYGIQAQSIGGSGGSGGNASTYQIELSNTPESLAPALSLLNFSSMFILGGNGGAGGNAGDVTANNTSNVWTEGAFGVGILAQSVGGGGGAGGNVLTFDFSNDGLPEDSSPYHDVLTNLTQFTQTMVVSNGMGGTGGNGGNITVTNSGDITTHGAFAHGILAQSVGGGGGFSGISDDLDLSSLLFSPGTQAQGDSTENTGSGVSFAGSVGGNGTGGNVTVVQNGNIVTYGNNAHGIYAQSAGGLLWGQAVNITVDGNIFAQGTNSDGIRAQSIGASGGSDISVDILGGTVQGGYGSSAGVRLLDGANNTLTNYGAITTLNGVNGTAIIGTGGNESINNHGVIIGSVDLGAGNNQFNNFSNSWFNAGGTINLGQGNLYRNAGVLCPGGNEQIQTTALTANFIQTADGTLGIKLAPISDLLAINGTATIDGTLAVSRFDGFVPTKGEQFTILTATDGVTGQFTTLDDPLKDNYALELRALYEANEVNLLTLQGSFMPFALTHNQRAVAQNLNTFSGYLSTNQIDGDPRETNLIAVLDAVPGPQLPADFDLIAPEELGALYDMEFGSVDTIVGNVQSRMNDLRNGYASPSGSMSLFSPGGPVMQLASADRSLPPMTKAGPSDDWSAYAGGYGQFVHVSSTANTSGYCLQNSGFILDFDKPLDNGLMGGFTLDYAGGEASLVNGGSANMEGGRAGVYGTWFSTNAYLEAQVGAGGAHYDSKRAALGGIAAGGTKGFEIDNMLGGGYDLKRNNFTAGMLAEMHYTYVDIQGFTESGSSSPLQIMENDSHSLWTLIGWRFAYDWHVSKETLRPELRLGWHHEFMDTTRTIQSQMASGAGTVFQVESPSLGRDSLSVVAGLSSRFSQHLSIFAFYDGELARDNTSSHAVNGGISWDF